MEKFIVSARKYRPATFDTVVGQPSITQTLKNAIRNNHLAQAFLFTGPRGVGKTTTARILAKTINCENITPNIEACNKCVSCVSFNEGNSLNIYELDAASNNSVEDIRALVEQVRYPPHLGKYKVYIIDEVHMLSAAAFNAFLKTLEEPPAYAVFILATTEKHKIIPTILSRCQSYDFNRITVEDIVSHLQKIAEKESIDADSDALHIIAQKADGALRDSLSLFDQLVSFAGNRLTYKDVIENLNILDYDYYFRITDDLLAGNFSSVLLTFNEILNNGFDPHNFINGLASHFRDLLVCKDEQTLVLLEVSPTIREKYKVQSKFCDAAWIFSQLDLCGKADVSYKSAKNHRLHIELALLKMSAVAGIPAEPVKKKTESGASNFSQAKPVPVVQQLTPPLAPVQSSATILPVTPVQPPVSSKEEIPASKEKAVVIPGRKSISISGKKNPAEEKKTEVAETLPDIEQPYSESSFLFRWKEFADRLQREGRMTLHAEFGKSSPVLTDNFNYIFEVANVAVEKDFNEIKTELLAFLRKELSNYKINIKAEVSVNAEKPAEAYTPSEKFKKLAEQNPLLYDLKKKLDLHIDH